MERAQLSTARGKERTLLIAARHACHFSQDEVAAKIQVSKVTVHRWEREGDIPQPLHLRKLCTLYGKTAQELGFARQEPEPDEAVVDVQTIDKTEHNEAEECALTIFRQHNLISRLMRLLWNWPSGDARYHLGMSQQALACFVKIDQLPIAHETNRVASLLHQVMAEVNRGDKTHDLDFCLERWQRGIQGAIAMRSEQTLTEAIHAYTALCIAWPGEKRVKQLRESIIRW